MLVRMLVGISGPLYTLGPGDEFHFPQDEAMRLISAGFAAPVAEVKIERAVVAPAPERRTAPAKGGKRGKNVVSSDDFGSRND